MCLPCTRAALPEGTAEALVRLERGIEQLSAAARQRLALENDDRRYSPRLLLPFCERLDSPMVYDIHHHRCNPDGLDVATATRHAAQCGRDREPVFHISSSRAGWGEDDPRPHADDVLAGDFPEAWRGRAITVDVEAKAKGNSRPSICIMASRLSAGNAISGPSLAITSWVAPDTARARCRLGRGSAP